MLGQLLHDGLILRFLNRQVPVIVPLDVEIFLNSLLKVMIQRHFLIKVPKHSKELFKIVSVIEVCIEVFVFSKDFDEVAH